MADKTVDKDKKDYTLLRPLRRGSKKDGSTKKAYAKGDKIKLTDAEAKLYNTLNLI